jgi:hypothetical protein
LLMPSSFCLPPVECSRGTTPIQAANSRPLRKAPSVADRGDDCGRRHRSDARDGHQPSAGFVLVSGFLDHRIGFVDPHIQVIEL